MLEQIEETVLIRSDLQQDDVIVAGLDEAVDRLEMTVPPRPGATPKAPEPLKHVIAEYKHQAQTITCVCGWHGSSASPDGRSSDWTAHVAANRTKPR